MPKASDDQWQEQLDGGGVKCRGLGPFLPIFCQKRAAIYCCMCGAPYCKDHGTWEKPHYCSRCDRPAKKIERLWRDAYEKLKG